MNLLTWNSLSTSARNAALQRPAQSAQKRTALAVAGILALVRRRNPAA